MDSLSSQDDLISLTIHGFPSDGGGAGTELRHQIRLWRKMGIQITIIPSTGGTAVLPEHRELESMGVLVTRVDEWDRLAPNSMVLSFCNRLTLMNIRHLQDRGCKLAFVNCMTDLFDSEKALIREGRISALLYQNPDIRASLEPTVLGLKSEKPPLMLEFEPWLDPEIYPYSPVKPDDQFVMGHISRPDPLKFTKDTIHIYESVLTPGKKSGIFLGFSRKCALKTGQPPNWIELYANHNRLSPLEFYRRCHIILQPTDTTENWPRIGLEAMASGCVLVVDRRGGWSRMIEHETTGFLCESSEEFSHYATRLSHDPSYRSKIARQAYESFQDRCSFSRCAQSWHSVMKALSKLQSSVS